MASLIIHSSEPIQAASFEKRVLIGRKPFNGVQFGQRVVSRLHAWIDRDGDAFYISDAGSRGGTFVNGQRTAGKVILREGDEIVVGPSKMSFHASDELPAGAVTFSISEKGTNPDFKDPGILIACTCGAPMWVPASMAGAYGKCGICKGDITIPGAPLTGIRRPLTPNDSIVDMPAITEPVELGAAPKAPADPLAADFPRPRPEQVGRICSICQSPILMGEPTQACPACSQKYHAECWRENCGCAAYGCTQVGALLPLPEADLSHPVPESAVAAVAVAARALETPKGTAADARPFPWDFALLGGSVIGTILGAFTFGIPALVVGAASAVYALRRRDGRYRVATLSALISLFGVAFGIVSSSFWWFNIPLWRSR